MGTKVVRRTPVFAIALAFFTLAGPAYGKKQKKTKEPAQSTIMTLSAAVPSLAALAETPQSQTKGGLRITLAPETYQAKESWTVATHPATATFLENMLRPGPNAVLVEKTQVPTFAATPDRLVFHVHLDNQLPRVFRGSGIAVQFNVAGKVANTDPSGYGNLRNIILPPRSEQDVLILGPPISTIPGQGTIGVFFYDVVTNIDQAGNVTEKQNFEWYFSYQTQTVEKEFTVPPPERGWVNAGR